MRQYDVMHMENRMVVDSEWRRWRSEPRRWAEDHDWDDDFDDEEVFEEDDIDEL